MLLASGAVVALVRVNSPWSTSYGELWSRHLLRLELRDWVNEGLMTIFFLGVGLEIKRELSSGSPSSTTSVRLSSSIDAIKALRMALGECGPG